MKEVRVAVKAIIKKEDKFLIIKEAHLDQEFWDLPGGLVDFGENPYDTLTREVMEEVHIPVEIIKPVGLFWFFGKRGDQIVCTAFLCEAGNYNIDITKNSSSEKIIDHAWVTKNEILDGKYKTRHESMNKLFRLL